VLFENYTLSSASSINPNFCGFYANDDKVYYESQGNVTERIFFNHKVDFPYVKSTRIYNNGQKYKPLLVNYMTQFCTYDDQSYFFAPHGHYGIWLPYSAPEREGIEPSEILYFTVVMSF
jgi:hypothetical protein